METFFELIRVALGVDGGLSHVPSQEEWQEMYSLSKKQTLTGICFYGVRRLYGECPEQTANLPSALRMRWLADAVRIQQRNELLNGKCVELQEELARDGFKSSILKGQGVAALYDGELRLLRQCGDIDIWVDGGMEKALRYCRERFGGVGFDYGHAHPPFFENVEVELHYRPFSMPSLRLNAKAQKWLGTPEIEALLTSGRVTLPSGREITVPAACFNAFFLLQHCYHHMFSVGVGLRQLLDYCLLLRHLTENDRKMAYGWVCGYGMERFASAVMWIMRDVFGVGEDCLLCAPDQQEGRFILNEIVTGGNFGRYDKRVRTIGRGKIRTFLTYLQHNRHLVTHYPSEFINGIVWPLYHLVWKRVWMLRHVDIMLCRRKG